MDIKEKNDIFNPISAEARLKRNSALIEFNFRLLNYSTEIQ